MINVRTLRMTLGILGIAFPVMLLASGDLRPSISAYHWDPRMGMFYTGVLWAIGVFLFSYRGPKFFGCEDLFGDVAAIGALMTATFYPEVPKEGFCDEYGCSLLPYEASKLVVVLHFLGTVLMLVSFVFFTFSYWLKSFSNRLSVVFLVCFVATVAGGLLP